MAMVAGYLKGLTKERMLKLIEYSDRSSYLPLEEDLLTPFTNDGLTCNEVRASIDDWNPYEETNV